jgi:hypothetical protein
LGIFLKFLIDRALQCSDAENSTWLSESVKRWRVHAITSDFAFEFDSQLSTERLQVLLQLIKETCIVLVGIQRFLRLPLSNSAGRSKNFFATSFRLRHQALGGSTEPKLGDRR